MYIAIIETAIVISSIPTDINIWQKLSLTLIQWWRVEVTMENYSAWMALALQKVRCSVH